jgi:hypothetical protein
MLEGGRDRFIRAASSTIECHLVPPKMVRLGHRHCRGSEVTGDFGIEKIDPASQGG